MDIESRRRRIYYSLKAELREVAVELFAKRGFTTVSFGDIAFAAGVSARTVLRCFREKEDILLGGFCESGPSFRAALMATPGTAAPLDAFQHAVSAGAGLDIPFERVLAILIHCETASKLRAMASERRRRWQNEVASAIADWLGCSVAGDFRPMFWAAAIFEALVFTLRLEAGAAGLNANFYDRAKIIELAFDHLRRMNPPSPRLPSGLANVSATAPVHLELN